MDQKISTDLMDLSKGLFSRNSLLSWEITSSLSKRSFCNSSNLSILLSRGMLLLRLNLKEYNLKDDFKHKT